MQSEDREREADEAPHRVGDDRGGGRPADARMQDQHHAQGHDRKHREDAGEHRARAVAQRDDDADQQRHQAGAQRNVEPPPRDDGDAHVQIALRQRHADAIGGDIEKDRARHRPGDRTNGERADDPGPQRHGHGEGERAPLRRQHIDHAENARRRMDREARDGAIGDERGAVIEREQNIGRPCADRQRHHHGGDQRARAFRDEGRGHHEGRGHRHLDREDEKEPKLGRHSGHAGIAGGTPRDRAVYPRCIRTSTGEPFRMVW